MGVVWLGLSAARGCPNHLCHRLLGSKPLPAGRASSHPEHSAIERAAAPGGGVCCPRGLNEPGFLEKCSRLFFLCSPPSLMPSASNPGPAFPQRRIFHFISLAACWSRAMALLTLHRVLQSSPYSWWTYQPHKILEVTPLLHWGQHRSPISLCFRAGRIYIDAQSILLSDALEESPGPSFPAKS